MRWRDDAGQASVELVGILPVLVVVGAVGVHLSLLGSSWVEARGAARVADRAGAIGASGADGVAALSPSLRDGARVRPVGEEYEVSVLAPVWGGSIRVHARSR